MMPVLLRRLAELDSIVDQPRLACKLTELLQAVLEWDQLKVWQCLFTWRSNTNPGSVGDV